MPVMDSRINGSGLDDRGKLGVPAVGSNSSYNGSYAGNGHSGGGTNGSFVGSSSGTTNGYTLMVAGQRTGKTSFLRLLLDSTEISQTATNDQLASVAKFIQVSSGHTSHIRTASIDVELDVEGNGVLQPLTLTLVDTPSLKFDDDSSERTVADILHHVESRFAEGIEDEWKARSGDHHVHLCIYFLDPEDIVPPSAPTPPAPLVTRARTNSFSHPDPEPVILEPPVTTNPLLRRPTLQPAHINVIRRLSARVNVLPVIARADTLTNDRLTAVRTAVRRDLAEAGIGFGIFDTDNHPQTVESTASTNGDLTNGYSSRPNGSPPSPRGSSSSASASPPYLRLPYALISPDIYSHTDGISRVHPTRHELILQYTPSRHRPSSKLIRGKFTRSYRWGSLDIMDPSHSDFLALRTALFHHMETLQKYTKEYLFDKFRAGYLHRHHQQIPASHHSVHHLPQGIVSGPHLPPLPNISRPTLAIDTAPSHTAAHRHSSHPVSRDATMGRGMQSVPPTRGPPTDPIHSTPPARVSPAATRSSKQRTKKITVACNFCRSRKLKCDGGRPACGQCDKRSNACDYQPQCNKRRVTQRQRKHGDDSDSDLISGEEPSADLSLSPETSSFPVSRRGSNVGRNATDSYSSAMVSPADRRDDQIVPVHMGQAAAKPLSVSADHRQILFKDNELPHIATLSFSAGDSLPPSHNGSMQGPPLAPIRPASEQQAAQRKRASTIPGRTRATSTTGPKIVACNFCRARKTKCDGAHPACSSCARRTLPCNYNHDEPTTNLPISRKKPRQSSASKSGPASSPPSQTPPTSSQGALLGQAPLKILDGSPRLDEATIEESEIDVKRKIEDLEPTQIRKRRRTEDTLFANNIP